MIEAKDLRIGNLVECNGKEMKVQAIIPAGKTTVIRAGHDIGCLTLYREYFDDNLNPIPITEEGLIKAGFEKGKWQGDIMFNATCGYIMYIEDRFMFSDNEGALSIEVKYIHKLQNIVYEISGEELTIKE